MLFVGVEVKNLSGCNIMRPWTGNTCKSQYHYQTKALSNFQRGLWKHKLLDIVEVLQILRRKKLLLIISLQIATQIFVG